ncbi:ABC transporter ATP-binding protein [Rhodococcus rhodochrous]|uniref:Trehalose import ATP-binding protein SugC n=1 Tax=Rhodococcus rhodochrous TaxID=1829 RepID=A0AAW4XQF4_RHORH|nr:ABC transporter ATP-binding protein [Rhodococcus rhodochrous]MCD2115091.1 ABC transporter ATP-binding protein [Rhodococcus rhodochrous]
MRTDTSPRTRREAAIETAGSAPTISTSLVGLGKTFEAKGRKVDAVKDINLHVEQGEYVVILGPSGCGKSTLIRCVAGLESPTAGSITVMGKTVYDANKKINAKVNDRNVGMVFQNYALWPHMSVEKNVAYPLKMRRVAKQDRVRRVAEVLEALECTQLSTRLPAELSGGQQQRIALARALVYEPGVLLLDEPLSNLDALLRVSLRTELLRLHRALGYTGLHITHDQEEALEMGDRIVLMREGRIEQVGPPEEVYARPVSPYAANFLGVRNRVRVRKQYDVLEHDGGSVAGSESLARSATSTDRSLELFVRSRDTHVSPGPATGTPAAGEIEVEGTVSQVVLGDGGRRQFVVDIGNNNLWFAQHATTEGLATGDLVHVRVAARHALLYEGETLINI